MSWLPALNFGTVVAGQPAGASRTFVVTNIGGAPLALGAVTLPAGYELTEPLATSLAVVRKIVETRGGRAWVESVPGQGAAFHFTWPRSSGQGASA